MPTQSAARFRRAILSIATVLIAVLALVALSNQAALTRHGNPDTRRTEATGITPPPSVAPTSPAEPAYPTSLPVGDLPGWRQVKAEDFDRSAKTGSFEAVYGSRLTGYKGFPDHDSKGRGVYAPERVLSVKDGVLNYDLHADAERGYVAGPQPTGYKAQKYGRYAFRVRASYAPGYRVAFLLWPGDQVKRGFYAGEIDMYESRLDTTHLYSYLHNTTGTPKENQAIFDWDTEVTTWHTVICDWTPQRITIWVDGRKQTSVDPAAIPQVPMRWVLQTQSMYVDKTPAAEVRGKVEVDWFAQYAYDPATADETATR